MGNVFAYRHIPGDILIYFRDKIKITSIRPKFSFQQMNGRSCIDCCSNILKLGNYIIFFILSLNISESIISKVKKSLPSSSPHLEKPLEFISVIHAVYAAGFARHFIITVNARFELEISRGGESKARTEEDTYGGIG